MFAYVNVVHAVMICIEAHHPIACMVLLKLRINPESLNIVPIHYSNSEIHMFSWFIRYLRQPAPLEKTIHSKTHRFTKPDKMKVL